MSFIQIGERMKIQTTALNDAINGIPVAREFLAMRRAGKEGMVIGPVFGTGRNIWWVTHKDGSTAPYAIDEFELV